MEGNVTIEHRGDCAVIRIAREAKRNALTIAIMRELCRVIVEAETDGAVAVVLSGGNTVFSAGADLDEVGNGTRDLEIDEAIGITVDTIRRLTVPVVAAIEGPCFGAAVEIAMACDLQVVGKGASFSIPATRLGLLYRPHAVATYVGMLGRSTVTRLLVFGERLSAEEALSSGLATHLVEQGHALSKSISLGGELSRMTMEAVRATKSLIRELSEASVDLAHWDEVRHVLLESDARAQAIEHVRSGLGASKDVSDVSDE